MGHAAFEDTNGLIFSSHKRWKVSTFFILVVSQFIQQQCSRTAIRQPVQCGKWCLRFNRRKIGGLCLRETMSGFMARPLQGYWKSKYEKVGFKSNLILGISQDGPYKCQIVSTSKN